MIQDIAPHRYDNAYHPTQPKDGDRVFFYQDGSTLLSRESSLPFTWEEANARADLSTLPCTYFFSIDDIAEAYRLFEQREDHVMKVAATF
mgnify:CR=1 FL=1